MNKYESLQDIFNRVPGHGSITIEEMHCLYRLVESVADVEGDIIEIGSFSGRSAATLAFARDLFSPQKQVIAVDFQPQPDLKANLDPIFKPHDQIIQGISPGVVDRLLNKFSLGFVDGDHSYLQATLDLSAVERKLQPYGCVAMHDAFHFPTVTRCIKEHLINDRGYGPVGNEEPNLAYAYKVFIDNAL